MNTFEIVLTCAAVAAVIAVLVALVAIFGGYGVLFGAILCACFAA